MDLKKIAGRINHSVKMSGKSNDVIGGKCGLKSGEAVRLWRTGKSVPLLKNIQALAKAVDVSADWIVVGYHQEDVISAHELPEDIVEMSRRISSLRPEVRKPIETMINELTKTMTFEYQLDIKGRALVAHDARGADKK